MKKLITMLLICTMLISLAACSGKSSAPTETQAPIAPASTQAPLETKPATEPAGGPVTGGTLNIGIHITPDSMWPNRDNGGIYWLTYAVEQLAYYDTYTGKLVYQLATDMKEDFDNNTITVTLRDNVLFHDGSKLNAEAAVWNLQMYLDSNHASSIGSPASFEIIDDLHFVVKYDKLSLESIKALGGAWIFSLKTYQEKGEDYYVTTMVGTGPFVQTEYIIDDHWTFERNDNYWGQTAYLDKIIVHKITDRQALVTSFLNGDIDMVYTGNETYLNNLTSNGHQPEFSTPTASVIYGMVNNALPDSPWANDDVRKAVFLYGIDFDALAYSCGGQYAEHYYTYSYKYDWHHGEDDGKSLYDPARAKQMLTDAGYPDGFTTHIYSSGRQENEATALQAALKMLGIEAEIEITEAVFEYRDGGTHEGIIIVGSQTNVNNFSDFQLLWSADGWCSNMFKYSDAYLEIADKCAKAADEAERTELLKQWAHALAYDDVLVIPIDYTPEYYFTQPYVHGFQEAFHGTASYEENLIWMDAH